MTINTSTVQFWKRGHSVKAAKASELRHLEICPSWPLEAGLVHPEVKRSLCPRLIDAATGFPFMCSSSNKYVS